jgi:hypothetical protein
MTLAEESAALVDVLLQHAIERPNASGYVFLPAMMANVSWRVPDILRDGMRMHSRSTATLKRARSSARANR